ncbi:MAG: flavodoxin family protein [Eubacterium sp.]|nr:flavodoxin family protein [Eubacterium sp.]
MGKNVLVITSSPRKEGNTNTIAQAFVAGALAYENKVEVFDAFSANLDGCHGDASCHERGFCGLKDDGVKLHELMCWADVLVLVSPVYWKSFTSYMKKVIDRFYPYAAPKPRAACTVKETYLIAAAGQPDESIFKNMIEEFDFVNTLLGFEKKGVLLAPGLQGPDEAGKDESLLFKAVMMGAKI